MRKYMSGVVVRVLIALCSLASAEDKKEGRIAKGMMQDGMMSVTKDKPAESENIRTPSEHEAHH